MKKSFKAFSLIEVAIVILIIAIVVAAVIAGGIIVKKGRITTAQTVTKSAPIHSIKSASFWVESSLDSSFKEGESNSGIALSTWNETRESTNKVVVNKVGAGPIYSNTINHVHAVRFPGNGTDYLQMADASFLNGSNYTIVVLEKRLSSASGNYFIGGASGGANNGLALGYSADGTIAHAQGSNSYNSYVTSYSSSQENPRIFMFMHDSKSGKKTYINGVLAAQNSDTTPLSGITTLDIGKNYNGEIGEIAIFTTALNDEERESVTGYLSKKWAKKLSNNASAQNCMGYPITETGCDLSTAPCTISQTGVSTSVSPASSSTTLACNQSGYLGSVSYTCINGVASVSGSCRLAANCSMSVAGVSAPISANHGASGSATCNATGYSGTSISYSCNDGTLSVSGSCSCAANFTGSGCSTCTTGYTGSGCSSCASGYSMVGGTCQTSCTINGVAGITDGTVVGYTSSSSSISCDVSGYTGSVSYTCTGGTFNPTSNCASNSADVVLASGSSYSVPAGYTQMKVWAVGGGGGGGGAINNDGTSAGGGGAGGVVYKTWSVNAGDTLSFSIGSGGVGGSGANNGADGGATTASFGGTTITANGGKGGKYNSSTEADGGTYVGGDGGSKGGKSPARSGDQGGSSGGGIGGVTGATNGASGGNGVNGSDVGSIFTSVSAAGYATSGGGAGADSSGTNYNYKNGGNATGFGASGGGAGWYGGNGGNGRFGGGGGGAAGFTYTPEVGGTGGGGAIVIKFIP